MNTDFNLMYGWNLIDWRKTEQRVFKLQKRIYRASSRGDVKLVHRLQRLLMKSWSARLLAVRRVTQDNQGKKTAGVDGVKSLPPEARLTLVNQLNLESKAKPTRRVWIPKPGTAEKRPLGIPTMHDRALQALVKLVLEPEWEAKFEPNSYGFRPGRSCHDAIAAIFLGIRQKPKFVLDADISKCFDRINHEQLLEKLNTCPTLRRQIRAWLKAGVMDGNELFPTTDGTPQGGVISPLLANIALHGMEEYIKEKVSSLILRDDNGRILAVRDRKMRTTFVRYADDFVILHKDIEVIDYLKREVETWLQDMGLELKPSKTRIAHTLREYENEKPGFNFLGFTVRQHTVGKYSSKVDRWGNQLGFKTIITPSKDSQKRHYKQLANVIKNAKSFSQALLIQQLNPIIRGWCNYFAIGCSKKTFNKIDHLLSWKLIRWGIRRHPNQNRAWVVKRYFRRVGNDNWGFASVSGEETRHLIKHAATPIQRHVKVKGQKSPYDGDWLYWSKRRGAYPDLPIRVAKLLKRQSGQCAWCGLYFRDEDIMEVDHIVPTSQGGQDGYANWQLLHRHCHDTKTAKDGSIQPLKTC